MSDDKIVEEHRQMVILSGNLSDFQLNNLKKYPYVVFSDCLSNVKLEYDFLAPGHDDSGKKMDKLYAGKVSYDFYFKEKELPYSKEEITYRLHQLKGWILYLFFLDTEVVFLKDGKKWEM